MRRRNGTTPQLTGMTMNDIRTASRLLLLTCVMLISPFVFSEELKVDNLLLNGLKAMNLTSSGTFKMTLSWVVAAKAALVS